MAIFGGGKEKIRGVHSVKSAVSALSGEPMSNANHKEYYTSWKADALNQFFIELAAANQATHDGMLVLQSIEYPASSGNYIENPIWKLINSKLPTGMQISDFQVGDRFFRNRSIPAPGGIPCWFAINNGVAYNFVNKVQATAIYHWVHVHIAKAHVTRLNTVNPSTGYQDKITLLDDQLTYDIAVIAGDATAAYSLSTSLKYPVSATFGQ
tara:strand:+ start:4429 stop:5058 length:630 start_codon:yes stop_codon:yes gene_type:complete